MHVIEIIRQPTTGVQLSNDNCWRYVCLFYAFVHFDADETTVVLICTILCNSKCKCEWIHDRILHVASYNVFHWFSKTAFTGMSHIKKTSLCPYWSSSRWPQLFKACSSLSPDWSLMRFFDRLEDQHTDTRALTLNVKFFQQSGAACTAVCHSVFFATTTGWCCQKWLNSTHIDFITSHEAICSCNTLYTVCIYCITTINHGMNK